MSVVCSTEARRDAGKREPLVPQSPAQQLKRVWVAGQLRGSPNFSLTNNSVPGSRQEALFLSHTAAGDANFDPMEKREAAEAGERARRRPNRSTGYVSCFALLFLRSSPRTQGDNDELQIFWFPDRSVPFLSLVRPFPCSLK